MSRYKYFEELSGDDRSNDDGTSDSDIDDGDQMTKDISDDASFNDDDDNNKSKNNNQNESHRIILHADVDCFYCQCEIIDRKLNPARPLAIGQKHIIVTSNYAARAIGIGKLMDRKKAQEIGGSALMIVDGSDLQRYRIHGRQIYEAFRRAIKSIVPESRVRKGCMDEMMADISDLPLFDDSAHEMDINAHGVFIYDDSANGKSSAITLTEDQSGAQTTIVRQNGSTNLYPLPQDDHRGVSAFREKVHRATILAMKVRQSILNETGFTTTIGLSYNPMMAKIGSGIRKPGTVNVLPPTDASQQLIHCMPLRKINGIGSRTMKALIPCLEQHHNRQGDQNAPWICSDLLQVPQNEIIRCLDKVGSGPLSSAEQCVEILNLCNGIDRNSIVDDDGTLQKSLSVENSLRQGTIRTKDHVLLVVEDLYRRLPILIKDRMEWSEHPSLAYPTTIRVTARSSFDTVGKGRHDRKFITRSQQSRFDGGRLICNNGLSATEAAELLRQSVTPLLQSLLFTSKIINVTRLNICVTKFRDINVSNKAAGIRTFLCSPDQAKQR